jgi:hypothetical protein
MRTEKLGAYHEASTMFQQKYKQAVGALALAALFSYNLSMAGTSHPVKAAPRASE